MQHIDIDPIPPDERRAQHTYNVISYYSQDVLCFTAQGLLELADWIEAHRVELTLFALADKGQST